MPPRTIAETCSSSSISHFEAIRIRVTMGANDLAELGLGQEQEVVLAAAPDEERRDHAALRRQDQRLARLGREDVVRDDPLQQVGGVGPLDPDVGARPDVRPAWRPFPSSSLGMASKLHGL